MFNSKKSLIFASALAVSLFAFTACNTALSVNPELISLTNSGKILPLENHAFDWGDVNIEGGNVDKTFKFKNDGDKDLIIKSAGTSCMCTTAEVKLPDGTLSPKFGMHEKIIWGGIVKPGEEFEVKVVFDPLAHGPDGVGPIQRTVFIETSSEINGNYAKVLSSGHGGGGDAAVMTEINLSGNVLYKADYEKKKSQPVS
ncbi:MAG: DUF1573 domain-containing protein [Patescibacteria group bacterium]